jgi:predicted CXXCH cytochrome family protein
VIVALAVAGAGAALATDAPHDASSTPSVHCSSCHKLHGAPGTSLTKQPQNYDLCASCHNQPGVGPQYAFPWSSADQAHPGATGVHHHFEGQDANPLFGAQGANHPEVKKRLPGGRLQCSACHDQHAARPEYGGKQRIKPIVQVAGAGAGKATLSLGTIQPDATTRGYLVKVTRVSPEQFQISNDNGRTWFGWAGGNWVAGAPGGRDILRDAELSLNDGSAVRFSAGGSLAVGDSWRFYVSYSFLRVSNADDALCIDCHRPRLQSHLDVRGQPGGNVPAIALGQTTFSHPVGVSLGSTPQNSYDRTAGPLDADGSVMTAFGGAGDGNPSNDLKFDSSNRVWCYTCHRTHNADSNSISVEQ